MRRSRTHAQQSRARRREHEADTSTVLLRPDALEEPTALEPVDVPGQGGRRDALGGELPEAQPGAPLDQPEERDLPARDAELLGLLSQLAGKRSRTGRSSLASVSASTVTTLTINDVNYSKRR